MAIVAGYANREQLAIKIKSVYAPVTPKPVTPFSAAPRKSAAFTGEGAWALSALPECLSQMDRTTGPRAYVLAHLPARAVQVLPGSTIQVADCRIFVEDSSVWVWRGSDRLRVPPPARLYRYKTGDGGNGLALLSGSKDAYDLRIYLMARTQTNSR